MIRQARRTFFLASIVTAAIALSACTLDDVVTTLKQADAAARGPAHSATPVPATEDGAPAQAAPTQTAVAPAAPTPAAQLSAPAAKAAAAVRPAESSGEFQALQRQLNELEVKVAALTAENQRQMERLTLVTNGAIADMEQLFNALRLELRSSPTDPAPATSTLRRRSSAPAPSSTRPPSGQGGPFQPLPPQARRIERAPADAAEPLLPDLQTLFMLHQIVRALPLTPPLEEAVVTGPFGYRRDPFNRRSAFHDGIDLQAPMRSPVHATASGTVAVAGMRPAYGRVVEIDHGFGIRTRYAHLASVAVREGDRIERAALIGALGSSGRSASPHLHYEVLFNGRPHDPADLLVLAEGIRTLR